jgi:integrase/recombinase XerD
LPFFADAQAIYAKYSGKLFDVTLATYLRYLSEMFLVIGLPIEKVERLTSHSGRKTAANFWLEQTGSIEIVSKMIGHKSIRITQSHYAKVSESMIEKAWKE